jgi:hypothetical protein
MVKISGFTQTTNELLYSSYQAATTSVPTTGPVTITANMPVIKIPANYFVNVGERSSSLRLEIGGLATATATVPTWQFGLYVAVLASPPVFATTLTLGTTATFVPTAETNYWWTGTLHIGLRTMAAGGASTIACVGDYQSDMFSTTAFAVTTQSFVSMPGPGAYTPLATYDTSQVYSLWPSLNLGAGTAGNTVTVQYCKLYGEN